MAAPVDFNHLVVKMLGSVKFRLAVMKDPEKALRSIKFKPTKQQVASLKEVDWNSLNKVFQAFRAGMHPDTIS